MGEAASSEVTHGSNGNSVPATVPAPEIATYRSVRSPLSIGADHPDPYLSGAWIWSTRDSPIAPASTEPTSDRALMDVAPAPALAVPEQNGDRVVGLFVVRFGVLVG
jgi:hypothetical protein